jgi:hypothetical protein
LAGKDWMVRRVHNPARELPPLDNSHGLEKGMGLAMVGNMTDLTQALAERVPGWDYRIDPLVDGRFVASAWRRSGKFGAGKTANSPTYAVRMLNEALREAGK